MWDMTATVSTDLFPRSVEHWGHSTLSLFSSWHNWPLGKELSSIFHFKKYILIKEYIMIILKVYLAALYASPKYSFPHPA